MAKSAEKAQEKLVEDSASEWSPAIEPGSGNGRPAREQIELRAYEIYLKRGCVDGQDVEDWVQAERELLEASEQPVQVAKAASA